MFKVFYTPPELDSYKIINVLEEYGIEISPGIGKLKHSIIRLGTMGTAANTNELCKKGEKKRLLGLQLSIR